jgi:hypothetical protein
MGQYWAAPAEGKDDQAKTAAKRRNTSGSHLSLAAQAKPQSEESGTSDGGKKPVAPGNFARKSTMMPPKGDGAAASADRKSPNARTMTRIVTFFKDKGDDQEADATSSKPVKPRRAPTGKPKKAAKPSKVSEAKAEADAVPVEEPAENADDSESHAGSQTGSDGGAAADEETATAAEDADVPATEAGAVAEPATEGNDEVEDGVTAASADAPNGETKAEPGINADAEATDAADNDSANDADDETEAEQTETEQPNVELDLTIPQQANIASPTPVSAGARNLVNILTEAVDTVPLEATGDEVPLLGAEDDQSPPRTHHLVIRKARNLALPTVLLKVLIGRELAQPTKDALRVLARGEPLAMPGEEVEFVRAVLE